MFLSKHFCWTVLSWLWLFPVWHKLPMRITLSDISLSFRINVFLSVSHWQTIVSHGLLLFSHLNFSTGGNTPHCASKARKDNPVDNKNKSYLQECVCLIQHPEAREEDRKGSLFGFTQCRHERIKMLPRLRKHKNGKLLFHIQQF